MRAAHEADYDGPANLRDAVAVAAAPSSRGVGVVVTLAGTIEPADDVTKTHTTSFTTFQSPNGGSLGRVSEGSDVQLARRRGPRRALAGSVRDPAPRVHLVTAGIGTTGELLDAAVAAGAEGVVVAATGSGNTSPGLLAAAERAIRAGIPVVLASRCQAGAVGTAYAFPGGSATWLRAGAIPDSDALLEPLSRVRVPIHGIWGEHDAFVAPRLVEVAAALRRCQPAMDFRIIPNAGHWTPYEAAGAVSAHLTEIMSNALTS